MMPNLPPRHRKKEASFGVYLKGWIENNPLPITTALELKQTEKDYIAFSALEAKQIAYLLKAKTGVWIRVIGTDGQPDYIWLIGPAYVVIRYPKCFCFIDIETFLLERDRSKRKSLQVDRAIDIAIKTVILK